MKPAIKNMFAVEPFQEQKATLYQRVPQPVFKIAEKKRVGLQTNRQTDIRLRIYICRDT